ncbi:hypothetical protein B0H11DRAFT_1920931 [Mycena galericulata]|nr:hypothetical protein B0H11DRAFT_1920931 [Mycena galericulata]
MPSFSPLTASGDPVDPSRFFKHQTFTLSSSRLFLPHPSKALVVVEDVFTGTNGLLEYRNYPAHGSRKLPPSTYLTILERDPATDDLNSASYRIRERRNGEAKVADPLAILSPYIDYIHADRFGFVSCAFVRYRPVFIENDEGGEDTLDGYTEELRCYNSTMLGPTLP